MCERALQGGVKAKFGYDRHERGNFANARDGTTRESVITVEGPLESDVPRDR